MTTPAGTTPAMTTPAGIDMAGIGTAGIDMAGFPVIAGNMSALRGHAMMIAVAGTGYIDTGERVHNTWQDLYPHYLAPEAGQLMAATGPVATVCRHVGRNLQQARDALVVYADTVETIQGELELLHNRATDVNTAIEAAGPGWRSDHDLVDRGNAVGDAITVAAVAFGDAQRVCVNALRALHGQPALTADDGDGIIDPTTELGYTLAQYRAAAQADPDQGGGLPWGTVTERDYPWYLDVVSAPLRFAGGLGDAVVNTALGIGAMVGYDHATGQTTSATAATAWTNLGKLVLAVGTYIGPGGAIRDQLGTMPGLEPGEAGQILTDTGKALIAYDQWDDDPARAAGNAVGNIALAVFGTKGAGAGLRGAGLALQLTHHASLTARTGTVLTRAGEAIARIPTLTELAGNTWRHLHPPDAPPTPPTPDAPPAPRASVPRETGTIGDDIGTRPTPSDRTADPNPGPGARPDAGVRSPEGSRPPPNTDNAARPDTTSADDPPVRRTQDDDTAIDEANQANATPSDRDLVTAGARPPAAHANGADPVPRAPDTERPPSRSGDDSDAPKRERPSTSPAVSERNDHGPGSRDTTADSTADGAADDVDNGASTGGTDPAGGAAPASTTALDDPSATSGTGLDVTLRSDSNLPAVSPGHRVLGIIDESRLTRDASGLISQIDGIPLAEHLADLSVRRAESFRDGRDAGLFTAGQVGKVTSTAIDSRTGAIAEGTNTNLRNAIEREQLHPLLAERFDQATTGPGHIITERDGSALPGRHPFPAPYNPLNHAEVKAVNELLWLRGADASPDALREIRVDNHFPFRGAGTRRAPCCPSCAVMLDGASSNAGWFRGFPPGPHNFSLE